MEEVRLSLAQVNRYEVIKLALAGRITNQEAAADLRLSVRQVQRLKRRVENEGARAVVHKNTGRKPWNAVPAELKQKVITLAMNEYPDHNFCHLSHELALEQKIKLSDETLRLWLRPLGLGQVPRRVKKHRRRRKRREREGALLFLDGSPHHWFGPEHPETCLLLSSDDATGKPLWGKFQPNEDRNGCFEVCHHVFRKFGLPVAFYLDMASQFTTTRHGGTHVKQGPEVDKTHFEIAMQQLAVDLIFAHSPQARGRGERLNGSFQGRLAAELKRKKITDCKSATKYLNRVFIPKYQKWFAQKPANPQAAWRKLPKGLELNSVLSAKAERVVAKDNTVSFEGNIYQLLPPAGRTHLIQARTEVQERFDGSIHFVHPKFGEIKAQLIEKTKARKKVCVKLPGLLDWMPPGSRTTTPVESGRGRPSYQRRPTHFLLAARHPRLSPPPGGGREGG